MPHGSATAAHLHGDIAAWSLTDVLLADLFQAFTGKPHPGKPKPKKSGGASRYRALRSRLEAQRARLSQTPRSTAAEPS